MGERKEFLLRKSKENLSAASLLYEKGMYNAAANRAYYSVFQIVFNDMLKNGIVEKGDHESRHKLVFIYMHKMFNGDTIAKFTRLMSSRKKSDYEQIILDEEEIDMPAINALYCDIKSVLG